ncbi:collagen alpha-4(VI) chain-like [Mya arenaria]|uniref:collagen alpha-4(VI) chain-like n=1 Tax=Mya arenaria TaxID=6604 RepID=UPI0022E0A2EA|nr:collagen alpha-4(VI) chain-like [Mya arenaria]
MYAIGILVFVTVAVFHQASATLPECDGSQYDLVFVLDSSSSVGEQNFTVMKDFVNDVIENLDIGPSKTRIGLITFSRYPILRIALNSYGDKTLLKAAVDNVPYVQGATETDAAIELLVHVGFAASRSDVPNIAIVVTDGHSINHNQTVDAANDAKQRGITMFAIGIGTYINPDELEAIASVPVDRYMYVVSNFNALTRSVAGITARTCNETAKPASTPAPTVVTSSFNASTDAKAECNQTIADIVFILDQSGSVGVKNWELMRTFVIDIVDFLDIGSDLTKVAVITFSNYPVRRLSLDAFTDKQALINAINQIPYYPGNTETDKAFDYLLAHGLEGDRKGAPDLAIVVTDGYSSAPDLTKIAADKVKQQGIGVFAIGVGSEVQMSELNYISSDPDSNFVYFVSNFTQLSSIENAVAKSTCEAPQLLPTTTTTTTTTPIPTIVLSTTTRTTQDPPIITTTTTTTTTTPASTTTGTTLPTAPPCVAKVADVVFVVDTSGSVGGENFLKVKNFIKETINVFDIGSQYTRIGVITFSTAPTLQFNLTSYSTKADILAAVDRIPYTQGSTDTAAAMEMLRQEGFTNERTNDPNIAIVITDGYSRDPKNTLRQAQLAKESDNVTLIAIGIGNETDSDELEGLASTDNMNKSLVYQVGDFEALKTLEKVVATVACGLVIVTPPSRIVTMPPVTTNSSDCFDVEACSRYGQDDCKDYHPYMAKNCRLFCGFCQGPPTTPAPCVDTVECSNYGVYICTTTSLFNWANEHCPKYCAFCGGGTLPTDSPHPVTQIAPTRQTDTSVCADLVNCAEYGADVCLNQQYKAWTSHNCRETCGFCSKYTIIPETTLQNNITCPAWKLPIGCTLDISSDATFCPMPQCPNGFTLSALGGRQP